MTTLSMRGVRGGVGVSSTLAAVGHALQTMGERVLLVDMCPENLLRLHFNLTLGETDGWARAYLDGRPWNEAAWRVEHQLHLLPYGRLTPREQARMELHLRREPQLWAQRRTSLTGQFDWVLFDLPQRLPGHCQVGPCDLPIVLLEADAACHVLLQQQPAARQLLVNRFDPVSRLQRDLLLIWQQTQGNRLLPLVLHRDAAVQEALAHKQAVGRFAPASLAALDATSLATWCLTRRVPRGDERQLAGNAAEPRPALHGVAIAAGAEPAAGG